ncbi:MAG: carbamoyl-phosphate synthase large subunit, partial [Pseudomonadota bacterium]
KDGRLVVIEMNPRVSRSSALASKATGFPIAKVAARLAVGYTLDELQNDITQVTPASFEPTIDYVVTKIPRFAFEKFPSTDALLTTSMKSVGEAMAIGRTFPESLQKALRSLETGLSGLDEIEIAGLGQGDDRNLIRARLSEPRPDRLQVIAQAFRHGLDMEDIHRACHVDTWFLEQIELIVEAERDLQSAGLPKTTEEFRAFKSLGFSDARIGTLCGLPETKVREARHAAGAFPVFKRIDTCAAEFEAHTPYMYSTYEAPGPGGLPECEAEATERTKVMILGGGPNRIGQGIEFDYCCCHAAFAMADAGIESIMVNCNPETVSTDYDTSDRLYFEPLTAEDVLEIIRVEEAQGTLKGVIVQFGGQTPLKLARALAANDKPIIGTSQDAIDLAEDRNRFQALLRDIGLKQPNNTIAHTLDEATERALQMGLPVLVRPSYVLGGRAMEIVRDETQLQKFLIEALAAAEGDSVQIDDYLQDAIEVDVDALSDGED